MIEGKYAERFHARYVRNGPDECWPWIAGTSGAGYGVHCVSSTEAEYAHRISYELAYGPIPVGLSICHRCDNPPCVNPGHLFCGDQADNMKDASNKGRLGPKTPVRGSRHKGAKLTEDEILTIRASPLGCRKLARIYGVSHTLTARIRNGSVWTHI